jgi:gluconate 2-dehydrogenase gamma chain
MAFGPDDLDGGDSVNGGDVSENPWGDLPMPPVEDDSGILWGAPPENEGTADPSPDHHHPAAPEGGIAPPSPIGRRRALQVLGLSALAATSLGAQQAGQQQQPRQGHATPNQPTQPPRAEPGSQPKLAFLTRAEFRTVGVLANDIIPKDARSGSATDAGVPAFMDFNLSVPETDENTRVQFRGGLRWLDTESRRRFNVPYARASQVQRRQILDDIAYPDKVKPEFRHGSTFFVRFRDMVASGFFSSAMGHQDLKWMGNTFNPKWDGCPPAALQKLGVTYDVMTSRVPVQE